MNPLAFLPQILLAKFGDPATNNLQTGRAMTAADAKCVPLKSKILFALKQFSVTSSMAKHRVGIGNFAKIIINGRYAPK